MKKSFKFPGVKSRVKIGTLAVVVAACYFLYKYRTKVMAWVSSIGKPPVV